MAENSLQTQITCIFLWSWTLCRCLDLILRIFGDDQGVICRFYAFIVVISPVLSKISISIFIVCWIFIFRVLCGSHPFSPNWITCSIDSQDYPLIDFFIFLTELSSSTFLSTLLVVIWGAILIIRTVLVSSVKILCVFYLLCLVVLLQVLSAVFVVVFLFFGPRLSFSGIHFEFRVKWNESVIFAFFVFLSTTNHL